MLLQACLNGARPESDHPILSSDPACMAHEAARAVEAGAGALHLHPKDAAGHDSLAAADVARWIEPVRRACPGVPVGVTTGAWAIPDVEDRVHAIASWTTRPDYASVNWHEPGAEAVVRTLEGMGVGIEAGIWGDDGLRCWARSDLRTRCRRVLVELSDRDGGVAADDLGALAARLVVGARAVAGDSPLLLHGEGRSTWPTIALAARLGLDTRIGLEDTLERPDGTRACDNAELVDDARAVISSLSWRDDAPARAGASKQFGSSRLSGDARRRRSPRSRTR